MKIFDGFEEIEILPWHECKDCNRHARFSDRLSALLFLQRFKTHEVAMDSLRRLLRERRGSLGLEGWRDGEVLEQVAQMLATAELHVTRRRIVFGIGVTEPKKEAWQLRPQLAPEPIRRPAAGPPPPPPEEPVFVPNVDPVAIAQVLTHAAQSGVPFCEE
jgi:hypothetical protein